MSSVSGYWRGVAATCMCVDHLLPHLLADIFRAGRRRECTFNVSLPETRVLFERM